MVVNALAWASVAHPWEPDDRVRTLAAGGRASPTPAAGSPRGGSAQPASAVKAPAGEVQATTVRVPAAASTGCCWLRRGAAGDRPRAAPNAAPGTPRAAKTPAGAPACAVPGGSAPEDHATVAVP